MKRPNARAVGVEVAAVVVVPEAVGVAEVAEGAARAVAVVVAA